MNRRLSTSKRGIRSEDLECNKRRKSTDISLEYEIMPCCVIGETPEVIVQRTDGDFFENLNDKETDEHRIQTRLKQLSYGKNTVGYDNYISLVPKHKRRGYEEHPRTPDPYEKQSKRTFDGRVKAWRRAIHKWDEGHPPASTVVNPTERVDRLFQKYLTDDNTATKELLVNKTTDDVAPGDEPHSQSRVENDDCDEDVL